MLTIAIVNWNLKDGLDKCLESIYKNKPKTNFEVYVVDNNSTDESTQMIKTKYPQVKLIENKENVYNLKANNYVIKLVIDKSKYFMILNNDTIIINNAIQKMIDFMEKNPQIGILGCRLVDKHNKLRMDCGKFPVLKTLFEEYFLSIVRNYPQETYKESFEPDVVCSCAILVKMEAIKKVGLMDERYTMYCDEVDWCYRMKKKGFKIFYFNEAVICHYGGESSKDKLSFLKKKLDKSRILFFKIHYGKIKGLIAFLIIYTSKVKIFRRVMQFIFKKTCLCQ